MRISVDIGGTFTDLVLESADGLRLFKAPTIPTDPVQSVVDALDIAASAMGLTLTELLGRTETFIHATTRALNAVLTGTTARTALVTTEGHRDVLLLREGGRDDAFDFTVPYPDPYIPRSLTFEVTERITSTGAVLRDLEEHSLRALGDQLETAEVAAIAVCLVWSTVNPAHELRVGEFLRERLPGVPLTLSHRLNPTLREYRRASSASIDASLKPIMSDYLHDLTSRLRTNGFTSRLLMVTSIGGVVDIDDVADAPIHAINSGPSMAPVAGRAYTRHDPDADVVIIADTGGTTYDVTLVRHGRIPSTRETWIGPKHTGDMTGFPSIDIKSVGAGGGSIAWVDTGGLLHVGPQSAGAYPGPACYGRGGEQPTVTDAALVLGYLDPAAFSAGTMHLDVAAATVAIETAIGSDLGLGVVEAADAVMRLTTEQMVRAIEEITLQQGIDPAGAVLIGGGGAAGLNAVAVAQRLGCKRLVIPAVGAALAAAGALLSDLMAAFALTVPTTSEQFDTAGVNTALDSLHASCLSFIDRAGGNADEATLEIFAEAHYPQQIWDLEVPVRVRRFQSADDLRNLVSDFHSVHAQVLGMADSSSPIEIVTWGARVRCPLRTTDGTPTAIDAVHTSISSERAVFFSEIGMTSVPVHTIASISSVRTVHGPAIIESAFTTIVLPPGSTCTRDVAGSLSIDPGTTTSTFVHTVASIADQAGVGAP